MTRAWTARPLLSPLPSHTRRSDTAPELESIRLDAANGPSFVSLAHLPRFLQGLLLNLHLLALLPPVCPASCNLSLFIYPPRENNANQPRPTLALLPGNPRQFSIPLGDFKKKKKREKKRNCTLDADVLFDISAKKPVAPAGIVPLLLSRHMF